MDLRRQFSNSSPDAKSLVKRLLQRVGKVGEVRTDPRFEDARGPNVRELRCAQRRLSPAEVKALLADYQAGGRVVELSKVYGVHRTTVSAHVARAGKVRSGLTDTQIEEAARLYRAGWTLRDVGRRLGVADQTVRRVLVEQAVTIRPGGRRKAAAVV